MNFFIKKHIKDIENFYTLTPIYQNLIIKTIYYLLISFFLFLITKNLIHYGIEFWIFLIEKFKLKLIFKTNLLEDSQLKTLKVYLLFFNKIFFILYYFYLLLKNLLIQVYIDNKHKKVLIVKNTIIDFQIYLFKVSKISCIKINQPLYKKLFLLKDLYIFSDEPLVIKDIYLTKLYLLFQ